MKSVPLGVLLVGLAFASTSAGEVTTPPNPGKPPEAGQQPAAQVPAGQGPVAATPEATSAQPASPTEPPAPNSPVETPPPNSPTEPPAPTSSTEQPAPNSPTETPAPAPPASVVPPSASPGGPAGPVPAPAGAQSPSPSTPSPATPSPTSPPPTGPAPATPASKEAPPEPPPRRPKQTQIVLTWDFIIPLRMPLTPSPEAGVLGGTGVQGISLELRYWWKDRWSIGGLFGYHSLEDKAVRSMTVDGATQTGTVLSQVSTNEILARVHYALADRMAIRTRVPVGGARQTIGNEFIPLVGLGLGAARFLERFDTGLSLRTAERWQVALVPELGLEIPTKYAPVLVAGRIHYLFGSSAGPEELYGTLSLGAGFD